MEQLRKDIITGEVRLNASEAHTELNALSKNTAELTKSNERLRQEKQRLEVAEKRDAAAINRINKEIKKNNLEVKRNKLRMEELQKVVGLSSLSKTQLTKKSRSLQRQLDATSKSANPGEYRKLSRELKAVDRQLNKVRRGASATQRIMNSAKSFGAGVLGAFSVTAIVSGIANLTKSLFRLSVKMEGDARRANIVFGDSMGYVEKQAAKLADKMGVTKKEFIAAASATADLLIPLDFTREQSAKMAVDLQSLTGALDEWTAGQVGAQQISEILTKAMLGENEQLKRLGIAIRKDSEEFRTLVKQKLATTNATKAQAEAMATLELIQKKSADAQTAYNQEGANQLRLIKSLKLTWQKLKEGVVEFFNVPQSQKLAEQRAALNRNVEMLITFNDNQKLRKEYIERIQRLYPSFFGDMDTERIKVEQIRDRLKEVNKQFLLRIKLAATSELLQEQEVKATKAQADIFKALDKMPKNLAEAVADYEKGVITIEQLRDRAHANDTDVGTFGTGVAARGRAAKEIGLRSLIEKYINLKEVINNANEEEKKLSERKSGLENILGVDGGNNTNEDPVYENINEKIKTTRDNIKQLKQDLADLRSGKKQSTDIKGDIGKTQKQISSQESLLATYTGAKTSSSKPTVTPSSEATETQINEWKEKAKELLSEAQREIAAAKVAAMDEGYEKEKAKENQRWQDELASLEARKIEKSEKQQELLPEQLAANEAVHKLIEEQKAAHLQRLDDMEKADEDEKQLKKTEKALLLVEEEIIKADEEDVAFEEKMALAQERYDLEFEAANGNRQKELEAKKNFADAVDKLQEEQHRKEAMRKQSTENLAKGLFNNLKGMAKKGSALAKALFLFEQAMAIKKVIIDTKLANMAAVAASPQTAGMPWVAINTALGAASVGVILAQTAAEFKGKEEGGYLDVRRQQDGKHFRAKHQPTFRGYTDGPTVITGENGMEFVASAKAAQNPTVRPFLDIIDAAQRQGTIETLNLSTIRAERYRGYADGGYLQPPPESQDFEENPTPDTRLDKMEEVMDLVKKLATRPIEFSLLKFEETRQLQEEIDNDVNR